MKKLKAFLYMFFIEQNYFSPTFNKKGQLKFSALLTDIKGKVGGQVFQRGKTGPILRNNNTKRNNSSAIAYTDRSASLTWSGCMAEELSTKGFIMPDGSYIPSSKTTNAKQNIRITAKAWGSLLPEDRASWKALAVKYPLKNRFGDSYTPSAFSIYMSVNTALINAGLSPVAKQMCSYIEMPTSDSDVMQLCFVCEGVILYCFVQPEKPNDVFERQITILQPGIQFEGENGFLVIHASPPSRNGRSSARTPKIIGVIKKTSSFEDFIINPLLNKFFGKNIYDVNFLIKYSLLNTGGSFKTGQNYWVEVSGPKPLSKIKATLKANTFDWSLTSHNFGIVPIGNTVMQQILVFAPTLTPNSTYTITTDLPGFGAPFSVTYGNPAAPLDIENLKTDDYGNILPIPVNVSFSPAAEAIVSFILTITAENGTEILQITFSGSGS